MPQPIVVRSDDPRADELAARGWVVTERSWAAELSCVDQNVLQAIVARGIDAGVDLRAIEETDLEQVLALDQDTRADYPGGPTTAHPALTQVTASVTGVRRAFGAISPEGTLVAMTFLDVGEDTAETDFTVVARAERGRGFGKAVKALAVLVLSADGVRTFRTGGSGQNTAIIAANGALGYVQDEEWLTCAPPR